MNSFPRVVLVSLRTVRAIDRRQTTASILEPAIAIAARVFQFRLVALLDCRAIETDELQQVET
jgi:hypothetical protein